MSAGPSKGISSDVNVKKAGDGWIVACANCWSHKWIEGWDAAIELANGHAQDCR